MNPAVDLAACCDSLTGPVQRFYDRHFAKQLTRHVTSATRVCGRQVRALEKARPRRIRDFDAAVTVPGWQFDTVEHYYARESAAPLVRRIAAPTLILSATDDPLVPAAVVRGLAARPRRAGARLRGGGHLGYIARTPRGVLHPNSSPDRDRRWGDWRVVDWLTDPLSSAAGDSRGESPGDNGESADSPILNRTPR